MRLRNVTLMLFAAALMGLAAGPTARAQDPREPCASFAALSPDVGGGYTVPLVYGSFADVEIASQTEGSVQLEIEVLQQSVIKDRRIWVLVPGRVVLLTEVLGVENLFELGSPLLVRVRASEPVSAILVRRD
jgi:hypothetical protein